MAVAMKICPCSRVAWWRRRGRRRGGRGAKEKSSPSHLDTPNPTHDRASAPAPAPAVCPCIASHHITSSAHLKSCGCVLVVLLLPVASCCLLATPLQQTRPRPLSAPPPSSRVEAREGRASRVACLCLLLCLRRGGSKREREAGEGAGQGMTQQGRNTSRPRVDPPKHPPQAQPPPHAPP